MALPFWQKVALLISLMAVVATGASAEPRAEPVINRTNATIYVLELDGKALTAGDLAESECQALLQALEPKIHASRKLACVKYDVERQNA